MQTKEQKEAIERLKSIENEVVELKKIINKKVYGDIRDRVQTLEDALEVVGKDKNQFNEMLKTMERVGCNKHDIASKKLQVIIEALNEGWIPDFSNKNQHKWYPWFKIHPCFELGHYPLSHHWYYCLSDVSSLFLFKNEELCKYAANQFLDIYKELITPSNR